MDCDTSWTSFWQLFAMIPWVTFWLILAAGALRK